jgi:hypothetical protein
MSDLTITQAGVTVAKTTAGEFLSADKKLNQMRVDVLTLTPVVSASGTDASGELLFDSTAIENMVSVKGGSCILHNITAISNDNNAPSIDFIFCQVTQDFGTAGTAISGTMTPAEVVNAKVLGHVNLSDWTALGNSDVYVGTKRNIGLALQADTNTKDVYVAAVLRTACTSAWGATSDLTLKFGVTRD